MSKAKVVYAVSDGSYSDYRVLCVCTTREVADGVLAAYKHGPEVWSEPFLEEFVILDEVPTQTPFISMSQNVWDDGRLGEMYERITHEWPFDVEQTRACSWRWVRAPIHQNRPGRLEVHGTDIERCRKVFTDKLREIRTVDALRIQKEATGGRS
jgi:hypothetical protein